MKNPRNCQSLHMGSQCVDERLRPSYVLLSAYCGEVGQSFSRACCGFVHIESLGDKVCAHVLKTRRPRRRFAIAGKATYLKAAQQLHAGSRASATFNKGKSTTPKQLTLGDVNIVLRCFGSKGPEIAHNRSDTKWRLPTVCRAIYEEIAWSIYGRSLCACNV